MIIHKHNTSSHIILPIYKLNTTPSHMMTIVKTRAILGPLRRS